MDENVLVATRRSLHAVAESVLAGPQYRAHGTIRLMVTPGGFGQVEGGARVDGADLLGPRARVPLTGTVTDVAAAAGLEAGVPEGLYSDHADFGADEPLAVDPDAAALLAGWFARGDAGLRAFAPDEEPVIWPEHFDLAIAVGEVNYGISLGDAGHQGPYAYVGPWTPREGPFWNVAFGALRPAEDLPDADAVAAFFAAGRAAADDTRRRRHGRLTVRPVPGSVLPEATLPDTDGAPRRLSELPAGDPIVVHTYRGWFCPKERAFFREVLLPLQEVAEVGYVRMVSVSVEPPAVAAAFRAGLDARWTFLSDERRTWQAALDLREVTDTVHDPYLPTVLVCDPDLTVRRVYDGYWMWGRPSLHELWADLREATAAIRSDWEAPRG